LCASDSVFQASGTPQTCERLKCDISQIPLKPETFTLECTGTIEPGNKMDWGQSCYAICNPEYIEGVATFQCVSSADGQTGVWIGDLKAECALVTCPTSDIRTPLDNRHTTLATCVLSSVISTTHCDAVCNPGWYQDPTDTNDGTMNCGRNSLNPRIPYGSWSSPGPVCLPVMCAKADLDMFRKNLLRCNRDLNVANQKYPYETICYFECDLNPSILSSIKCRQNGWVWNGAPPVCPTTICSTLSLGGARWETLGCDVTSTALVAPDTVCTQRCLPGHVAFEQPRVCRKDGTWSQVVPMGCLKLVCPATPEELSSAGYRSTNCGVTNDANYLYPEYSRCSLVCNDGYVGNPTVRICQPSGVWSAAPPRCIIPECARSIVTDASWTTACDAAGITPNQLGVYAPYGCTMTCVAGFRGSAKARQCKMDATWSSANPVCVPITCSWVELGLLKNAPTGSCVGQSGAAAFGTSCTVGCQAGYSATPSTLVRECTADGWSEEPLLCQETTCPVLTNSPCSLPTQRRVGAVCDQTCGVGQVDAQNRRPAEKRTCQADGSWTAAILQCIDAPCRPVEAFTSLVLDFLAADLHTCNAVIDSGQSCSMQCRQDNAVLVPFDCYKGKVAFGANAPKCPGAPEIDRNSIYINGVKYPAVPHATNLGQGVVDSGHVDVGCGIVLSNAAFTLADAFNPLGDLTVFGPAAVDDPQNPLGVTTTVNCVLTASTLECTMKSYLLDEGFGGEINSEYGTITLNDCTLDRSFLTNHWLHIGLSPADPISIPSTFVVGTHNPVKDEYRMLGEIGMSVDCNVGRVTLGRLTGQVVRPNRYAKYWKWSGVTVNGVVEMVAGKPVVPMTFRFGETCVDVKLNNARFGLYALYGTFALCSSPNDPYFGGTFSAAIPFLSGMLSVGAKSIYTAPSLNIPSKAWLQLRIPGLPIPALEMTINQLRFSDRSNANLPQNFITALQRNGFANHRWNIFNGPALNPLNTWGIQFFSPASIGDIQSSEEFAILPAHMLELSAEWNMATDLRFLIHAVVAYSPEGFTTIYDQRRAGARVFFKFASDAYFDTVGVVTAAVFASESTVSVMSPDDGQVYQIPLARVSSNDPSQDSNRPDPVPSAVGLAVHAHRTSSQGTIAAVDVNYRRFQVSWANGSSTWTDQRSLNLNTIATKPRVFSHLLFQLHADGQWMFQSGQLTMRFVAEVRHETQFVAIDPYQNWGTVGMYLKVSVQYSSLLSFDLHTHVTVDLALGAKSANKIAMRTVEYYDRRRVGRLIFSRDFPGLNATLVSIGLDGGMAVRRGDTGGIVTGERMSDWLTPKCFDTFLGGKFQSVAFCQLLDLVSSESRAALERQISAMDKTLPSGLRLASSQGARLALGDVPKSSYQYGCLRLNLDVAGGEVLRCDADALSGGAIMANGETCTVQCFVAPTLLTFTCDNGVFTASSTCPKSCRPMAIADQPAALTPSRAVYGGGVSVIVSCPTGTLVANLRPEDSLNTGRRRPDQGNRPGFR